MVGEARAEPQEPPFAGAAGQLLDAMLAAVGLSRDAEFVEVRGDAPHWQQQVAQAHPHVILAMGRSAAQALLHGSEPLGRLRGRAHQLPQCEGVPVIVTYHPAYLLRNPADKARAWQDLCLAAQIMRESLSD